jgi:hypothetical protein
MELMVIVGLSAKFNTRSRIIINSAIEFYGRRIRGILKRLTHAAGGK